jgi:regulator of sigma E protease
MGIVVSRQSVVESYSPPRAAWLAVQDLGNTVGAIPTILGGLSQHHSQVQGPIGIAQDTTQAVQNEPQTGFSLIVFLVAALSASLGVLNLLPFPALDGGRLIFVLLSLVRRRNVDPELEGMIHLVGMAVLLMLIIVISYQDLSQIVGGGAS